MYYHLFPKAGEAAHMRCACALQVQATAP
jgi:hypothetical protein